MGHSRKSSSALVVLLIVGALLLILGYVGHIHVSGQRRYLVSAVTHQIDSHAASIARLLSEFPSGGPLEIEDAVYSELQRAPSTSLITREMVSVRQSKEKVWVCVIDITTLGLQPRQIREPLKP